MQLRAAERSTELARRASAPARGEVEAAVAAARLSRQAALAPAHETRGMRRSRDSTEAAMPAAATPFEEAPKRSRASDSGRSRPTSSGRGLAAAGLLALAEAPVVDDDIVGAAVLTPMEQAASRAERARSRAMQWADDASAVVLLPPPTSPQFDTANPYAAGTLKSACWSVLEPAGAAGLSTSAIASAVSAAGLVSWNAARTPTNSVTAALGQEAANFARVAPATYALRLLLPYPEGTPRPRLSPTPTPVAASAAAEQEPVAAVEQALQEAAPAESWPATLMVLSLNELRQAFLEVCGRATKSKNKAWLRNRLTERGFTGEAGLAAAPAECDHEQQPPAAC